MFHSAAMFYATAKGQIYSRASFEMRRGGGPHVIYDETRKFPPPPSPIICVALCQVCVASTSFGWRAQLRRKSAESFSHRRRPCDDLRFRVALCRILVSDIARKFHSPSEDSVRSISHMLLRGSIFATKCGNLRLRIKYTTHP